MGRTQQDRQEEDWSLPANVDRRENDTERCESPRAPPPPADDRLFTDWSSIDSPRERMSQHGVSTRNTKPNVNLPDNQNRTTWIRASNKVKQGEIPLVML